MDGVNLFKDFVCNALIQCIRSDNYDLKRCLYIMSVFSFRNITTSIDRYIDTLGENDK